MTEAEYPVESEVKRPLVERKMLGRRPKYPFGTMKVGDSFSFPGDDTKRIRQAAYSYGSRTGLKFSYRRMPDGSGRIWRIA